MVAADPHRLWARFSFHPAERTGGGNGPGGQLTVDSGIMNLHLFDADYDENTQKLWRRTRLRDRVDAIIAHEFEEYRHGSSHVEALKHAPITELPISDRAREVCRAMKKGWRRR